MIFESMAKDLFWSLFFKKCPKSPASHSEMQPKGNQSSVTAHFVLFYHLEFFFRAAFFAFMKHFFFHSFIFVKGR